MGSKAGNTKSKSSSILKPPKQRQPFSEVQYDSSFEASEGTTIANRRVSFAGKKHVKEFCDSLEQGTVWDNTYEESDVSSMHIAATSHLNLSSNEIVSENAIKNTNSTSADTVSTDIGSRHIFQDDKQYNAKQFFHDESLEVTEIPLSSVQTQTSNHTILFPNVSMEMTDVYVPMPQERNKMDMSMEITEVVAHSVSDLDMRPSNNKTVVYHDDSMEMTCALQLQPSNRINNMDDDDDDGAAMEFTKPIQCLLPTRSIEHSHGNNKENDIQNQTRIFHESMILTEMVPLHILPQSCTENLKEDDHTEDIKTERTTIFEDNSMTLTKIFPSRDLDWKQIDKENDSYRCNMTNINMGNLVTFSELGQPSRPVQLNHSDNINETSKHQTKIYHNESMTLTNVLPSVAVSYNNEVISDTPSSGERNSPSRVNEYHEMSMELTSAITRLHPAPYEVMNVCSNTETPNECNQQTSSENNSDYKISTELLSEISASHAKPFQNLNPCANEKNTKQNSKRINECYEILMELTSAITSSDSMLYDAIEKPVDKQNTSLCNQQNPSKNNEFHEKSMELINAVTNFHCISKEVMESRNDQENVVRCDKENTSGNNVCHEISMELTRAITGLHPASDSIIKSGIDKDTGNQQTRSENNEKYEMSMELTTAIDNVQSISNAMMKADNEQENSFKCDKQNLSGNNENHEISMELTRAITGLHPVSDSVIKTGIDKDRGNQQTRSENNEKYEMSMELTTAIDNAQSISNAMMKADNEQENSFKCDKQNLSGNNENHEISMELTRAITRLHPVSDSIIKTGIDKHAGNQQTQSENNEKYEISMELTTAIDNSQSISNAMMKADNEQENSIKCHKQNLSGNNENHEISMELTRAITGLHPVSDSIIKTGIDKDTGNQQTRSKNNEKYEISMELTTAIANAQSISNAIMKADNEHENSIKCDKQNLSGNNENHEISMELTRAITGLHPVSDSIIKTGIDKDTGNQQTRSENNEKYEISMELTTAIDNSQSISNATMKADNEQENTIKCDKQNLSGNNENHEISMELTRAITGLHPVSDSIIKTGIDKDTGNQPTRSKNNEKYEISMELTTAIANAQSISNAIMKADNEHENSIKCDKQNLSGNNENHEISMELTRAITGLHPVSDSIIKIGIDKDTGNQQTRSKNNEKYEISMELTTAIDNSQSISNATMKADNKQENSIKCDKQNFSRNNENHEILIKLASDGTGLSSVTNEVIKAGIDKTNATQDIKENQTMHNEKAETQMELTTAVDGLHSVSSEVIKAGTDQENTVEYDRKNLSETNEIHEVSMELINAVPGLCLSSREAREAAVDEENAIKCNEENRSENNVYHETSIELNSAIIGSQPAGHNVINDGVDKENTIYYNQLNLPYFEDGLKNSDRFLDEMNDEEQHFFRKSLTLYHDSAQELQLIQPPSLICTDSILKESFYEDELIVENNENSDNTDKVALNVHQERLLQMLSCTHQAEHICRRELSVSQNAQSSQKLLSEDVLKENLGMKAVTEMSDTVHLSAEIQVPSIKLDPLHQLIENIKDQAQRDDCIWNVFAEDIDKKMIATSFISNSLVVAIFLDHTVKEIKIISRLLHDNDEGIKMVHRVIMEKLDVHELKDTYAFYEDVLPLLTYISREVMLAMDFMFDLQRLNDLNLMEITENRVSFVSRTKKMKIILKVTIDIKPFDRISRNDITVCALVGLVRENDIKDLFMSIKKNYMFLRKYMEDVQTYIELMELS